MRNSGRKTSKKEQCITCLTSSLELIQPKTAMITQLQSQLSCFLWCVTCLASAESTTILLEVTKEVLVLHAVQGAWAEHGSSEAKH